MINRREKESAIKEYLEEGISSHILGLKYGFGKGTVRRWVMEAKDKKEKQELQHQAKFGAKAMEHIPAEVKQLQDELRDSRLKVCLLEAMIDISDEQFGTNIRKKAGTRPS